MCPYPSIFQRPPTFLGSWPLPSSRAAASGQVLLMMSSSWLPLLPSSTFKYSGDYIGPTWKIQTDLSFSRSADNNFKSLCCETRHMHKFKGWGRGHLCRATVPPSSVTLGKVPTCSALPTPIFQYLLSPLSFFSLELITNISLVLI